LPFQSKSLEQQHWYAIPSWVCCRFADGSRLEMIDWKHRYGE